MRSSRVLLVGLRGLGYEIAKNIVLTGIGERPLPVRLPCMRSSTDPNMFASITRRLPDLDGSAARGRPVS